MSDSVGVDMLNAPARHDTDVGLVQPPSTGQPIGRSMKEGLRRGTADRDGLSGQETRKSSRHNRPGSDLGFLVEISSRRNRPAVVIGSVDLEQLPTQQS